MLVLTRRKDQKVLFPNLGITVEVVEVSGKSVRLGIDAPRAVRIVRGELECFDRAPSAPVDKELARRQLDAANLAIHLARNQLQQGLTDLAEQAIQQALSCLESLDQSFALASMAETPADLAVHETRSRYSSNCQSGTFGMVLEGTWQQRQAVTRYLGNRDLQLVSPENSLQAIEFLLSDEQPEFALIIDDMVLAEDHPMKSVGDVLGSLRLHPESLEVAGQPCAIWASPGFLVKDLVDLVV